MNNQKTDTITYITSPEGLTAIIVASSNTIGREWYWVFTDHLGSITTLVRNSDGQKYEMSYDAWGNRRDPATWRAYTTTAPEPRFDRGFTGHEHLYAFNLINMNGRFYDPIIGNRVSRFGIDAAWVQDLFQNGIHRWVVPTPYFNTNYGSPSAPFLQGGYVNPFSLYTF